MKNKSITLIVLISSMMVQSLTATRNIPKGMKHYTLDLKSKALGSQRESQGDRLGERSMQTVEPRPINIYFDTSGLATDPNTKSYLQKVLDDVVLDELRNYIVEMGIEVFDAKHDPQISSTMCGSDLNLNTPGSDYTSDPSAWDLILFFVGTQDSEILGFAGPCKWHPNSGRNVVGVIGLNTGHYGQVDKDGVDEFRSTVWHEILHIMAVSNGEFPYFQTHILF